jgi:hypothetical protein
LGVVRRLRQRFAISQKKVTKPYVKTRRTIRLVSGMELLVKIGLLAKHLRMLKHYLITNYSQLKQEAFLA